METIDFSAGFATPVASVIEAADGIALNSGDYSDLVGFGSTLGCTPNPSESPARPTPTPPPAPDDLKLNAAILIHQRALTDWELGGLSLNELANRLHLWADDLWLRFLPLTWKHKPVDKTNFLFLFDWESPRILGHYHPGRNNAGFRWEISINPRNLHRLSEIDIASIALHETLHCFEDIVGSAPRSRNGYHSGWLRQTADHLGIPCTRFGCSCGIRPKSPFMDWARQRGLNGTPILNSLATQGDAQAAAKRKSWICECPAGKRITAYVPAGSKLAARCECCQSLFHPKKGNE